MDPLHRLPIPGGEIDLLRRVVQVEGTEVALTGLEVDLVRYLAARPGVAVSRRELLDEVWGYGSRVRSRAVDNTVRRLRHKIEPDPSAPVALCTVHGHGYRWDSPPRAGATRGAQPTVTMTGHAVLPSDEAPVLLLVHHPDPAHIGARHVPGPRPTELGREAVCFGPSALADRRISRRHAAVSVDEDRVVIEDLGSHNGTWVNGHRVAQAVLEPGDVVQLGDVLLLALVEPRTHRPPRHPRLVGRSAAWSRMLEQLAQLAVTDGPVTVVGPPGSETDRVARELRQAAPTRSVEVAHRRSEVASGRSILALPGLGDRPDDILEVARDLAGAPLTVEVAFRLLRHRWTGDVAELAQVMGEDDVLAALDRAR